MDKNEIKEALRKEILKEAGQLAEALAEETGNLLKEENPKAYEEAVKKMMLEFNGRMMAKALEQIDDEVVKKKKSRGHHVVEENGEALPFRCNGRVDRKGRKQVTIDTTVGGLHLHRETGQCKECHFSGGFLDEFLQITPQKMTLGLASAVGICGTCESYESASKILRETVLMEIDDNRVGATLMHLAERAEPWVMAEGEELEKYVSELPEGKIDLYVGVDGGRIRIRDLGWKEPVEAVVWWYDPETENRKKFVFGDPKSKEAILGTLDRFIKKAQLTNPELTLIIIADGAEWIWDWARTYKHAIKILDYYHLKEKVSETAKALHPRSAKQAEEWRKDIMDDLWLGRVRKVMNRLDRITFFPTEPGKAKAEAVRKLTVYLKNHKAMIDYLEHDCNCRHIGSGIVESTCKQLFNMRLKGAGMFWSYEGAKAVIQLRCLYISDRWHLLWENCKSA